MRNKLKNKQIKQHAEPTLFFCEWDAPEYGEMSDDPQSDHVLHHWREAHRRFYFVSENMTVMIATPDHLANKTNTRRDLGKF